MPRERRLRGDAARRASAATWRSTRRRRTRTTWRRGSRRRARRATRRRTRRGTQGTFNHATVFPLVGVHATQACAACHVNGVYAGTPRTCVGCHLAKYQATTNPNHVAAGFPTTCETCHKATDTSWTQGTFNHATVFPLVGVHATQPCAACHVNGVYAGTPRTCVGCHLAKYQATTNPNHVAAGFPTTCETCHKATDTSWHAGDLRAHVPGRSSGSTPRRPASRATRTGSTRGSRRRASRATWRSTTRRRTRTTWRRASRRRARPATRRRTRRGTQGTFNHTWFPITSGRHAGNPCSACHTAPTNYAIFTCITCHGRTETDSNHRGVTGYVYDSLPATRATRRGGRTEDATMRSACARLALVLASSSCLPSGRGRRPAAGDASRSSSRGGQIRPDDGSATVSSNEAIGDPDAPVGARGRATALEYGFDGRGATYGAGGADRQNRFSLWDAWVGGRFADGALGVRVGQQWITDLGGLGSVGGALVEVPREAGRRGKLRPRFGLFGGLEPKGFEAGYVSGVKKGGAYAALDGDGRAAPRPRLRDDPELRPDRALGPHHDELPPGREDVLPLRGRRVRRRQAGRPGAEAGSDLPLRQRALGRLPVRRAAGPLPPGPLVRRPDHHPGPARRAARRPAPPERASSTSRAAGG